MKHVRRSVLLWYSPREMYTLVTAVEDYPRFLPWCESACVTQWRSDGVNARLGLAYAGVRHSFSTRNVHVADESVTVSLLDGPFSALEGVWLFRPIRRPGTDDAACKIEFDMRYGFASAALEAAVSPVFDRVANTFVDSFVRRAEEVYGPR